MAEDASEAVRLVAGMLRRGEAGEAFRERRQTSSWSVSEAGLVSPAFVEERGTAVRIRRERESLLVARGGDGPASLREAVREAARRAGGAPFFKAARKVERVDAPGQPPEDEEQRTAALAAAVAHAIPDPRGLSVTLSVSWVSLARAVITPRALLRCGERRRLLATGLIARAESQRPFAYQSGAPWAEAVAGLGIALREATRPAAPLPPPEGEVDVVLSPAAAAAFWHEAVGHPLEAEGAEATSVLARVPGALVAPRSLSVLDDPTRKELPGGYVADDEGVSGQAVTLIQEGRIAGLLTDRATGGAESNGHGRVSDYRRPPRPRLSNLICPPGAAPLAELLERCGTGLHVRDVSSGAADPESGRFLLVVESAETIRRGKPGAPVRRFTLSGDILGALGAIDPERGDTALPAPGLALCVKGGDPVPVGASSPALLIRGLLVRGVRR